MSDVDGTEPNGSEVLSKADNNGSEEKKEEKNEDDFGYVQKISGNLGEPEKVQADAGTEEDVPGEDYRDTLKCDEEVLNSVKNDINMIVVDENVMKLSGSDEKDKIQEERRTKCDSGSEEEDVVPPALPPRPPRIRQPCTCACGLEEAIPEERIDRRVPRACWSSGLRKYVFLCTACGSLSILLGALFLTVYFMLKSYTSSLNHFETIPTYVPSGMLVATGFLIICLAWRKNRNSFLMKLCGLCSLSCAVLCVSVTVTTTVIHMNRLQTLRECLYTQKTLSCTCYSVLIDNNRISDEGIKFVFNSTPDCEVIHGALYSCLRAIFGLSVIGILVCIFSCMLVYQLLSHEKKKMYWAQLEMRCRYLYRQQRNPHYYSCCDECRYPPHPQLFPWELMRNSRFWSTGRIGNLYTPNPEDRGLQNRLRSGWNWRRLPWSRGSGGGAAGANGTDMSRTNLGSPDSQYGFSSTVEGAPYTVLDPRTTGGIPACPPPVPGTDIAEGSFYSWGPPPPYASNRNSANNSPARRSLGELLHQVSPVRRNDNVSPVRNAHHVHRHHVHHARRCASSPRQVANVSHQPETYQKTTPQRNAASIANIIQSDQHPGMNTLWSDNLQSVHSFQKYISNKDNYENMYEPESHSSTNGFNTLPSSKKKNQTRASEVFQNEPFTAYFFSSAENLGCSTSNLGSEVNFQNESLPPRVSLTNHHPTTTRHDLSNGSMLENNTTKSTPELDVPSTISSTHQPTIPAYSGDGSSAGSRIRHHRLSDKNATAVKKLLINCSPTKQKSKLSQSSQVSSLEEKSENLKSSPKTITTNKIEEKDNGTNDNIITFHCRVGIPRSPNIQNFSQFSEKIGPCQWAEPAKDEPRSNDGTSTEMSQVEAQKTAKSMKYLVRDVELLQKHNSLIKEFKTLDLGRNPKYKDNKKVSGIENVGFHVSEETTKDKKHQFLKHFHDDLEPQRGGKYSGQNQDSRHSKTLYTGNGADGSEEYLAVSIKPNENESDVYFADISNSSCYDQESSVHEETVDDSLSSKSRFRSTGEAVLNKQNLTTEIESNNETSSPHDVQLSSKQPQPQHSDVANCMRYSAGYRHPRIHNKSSDKSADDFPNVPENYGKNQKRSFTVGDQYLKEMESKASYFSPVSVRDLKDSGYQPEPHHYHHHHHHNRSYNHHHQESTVTSNDEQSSGSLTGDSGISTGRGFLAKRYETAYNDVDLRLKNEDDESNRIHRMGDGNFDMSNSKYSSPGCKIIQIESLGDFSHPLFQKPKVLPRGNRYKNAESKIREPASTETGIEADTSKSRNRTSGNAPKMKSLETAEEISNQLLSTCNLSLSPRYLTEESRQFNKSSEANDEISVQRESYDERLRKSPKPLPRTTVPGQNVSDVGDVEDDQGTDGRSSQVKDKMDTHFLAPDAQYEYQGNYKPETKPKPPQNSARSKPPISVRPQHLQGETKKSAKIEGNCNVQVAGRGSDSGRPAPRRRRNGLEPSDGKIVEIGTHSVNV